MGGGRALLIQIRGAPTGVTARSLLTLPWPDSRCSHLPCGETRRLKAMSTGASYSRSLTFRESRRNRRRLPLPPWGWLGQF